MKRTPLASWVALNFPQIPLQPRKRLSLAACPFHGPLCEVPYVVLSMGLMRARNGSVCNRSLDSKSSQDTPSPSCQAAPTGPSAIQKRAGSAPHGACANKVVMMLSKTAGADGLRGAGRPGTRVARRASDSSVLERAMDDPGWLSSPACESASTCERQSYDDKLSF